LAFLTPVQFLFAFVIVEECRKLIIFIFRKLACLLFSAFFTLPVNLVSDSVFHSYDFRAERTLGSIAPNITVNIFARH
jgi:hypothetical protein